MRGTDGKKLYKKASGAFLALLLVFSGGIGAAAADILPETAPYPSYTYDFEFGRTLESPHAYLPGETLRWTDSEGKGLLEPSDLFITEKNTFVVADTGNNRVVEFAQDGTFLRELTSFYNSTTFGEDTFNLPQGVFVSSAGELYVADTKNGRVIWFNADWKLKKVFLAPVTDMIDKNAEYLPIRVACDTRGRIFILAQNVNQGIIEIDQQGKFLGFLGSAKVKVNALDLLWRTISTDAQKKRMTQFVPSEYNNLCVDGDGFIYCTTSAVSEADLLAAAKTRSTDDRYAPVRRINPSGTDVLKRTGAYPPLGDLDDKSFFTDVAVRDNGLYSVLDSKHGRIFTYDVTGNLLYAFGQTGDRAGEMKEPVSIGCIGDTLYVLEKGGWIQSYRSTEYGDIIHEAARAQARGDFDEAVGLWTKALDYNHNLQLAFVEIGKSQLRQNQYEQAMQNFQDGSSRVWYSEAKKLSMNEWMNRYFTVLFIVVILAALLLLLLIFRKKLAALLRKKRRERMGDKG